MREVSRYVRSWCRWEKGPETVEHAHYVMNAAMLSFEADVRQFGPDTYTPRDTRLANTAGRAAGDRMAWITGFELASESFLLHR